MRNWWKGPCSYSKSSRDRYKIGLRFDFESGKIPNPLIPDSQPETIRKSVEGSLKRLGTDHIDLYFQHRIDPAVEPEQVAVPWQS